MADISICSYRCFNNIIFYKLKRGDEMVDSNIVANSASFCQKLYSNFESGSNFWEQVIPAAGAALLAFGIVYIF